MELRHLRYFTAVAEEATVVAASRRLGVAQPALTRQIHALERELGLELFERHARGVALTPAGEVLLASAREVLRQVDAGAERAREASRGVSGSCVVCVGSRALASGLIARIVSALATQYPGIELRVVEGMMHDQFRALRTGEADIGLGIPAPATFAELASETVDYDVFDAIVISSSHPLAARPSLTLAELAGETFHGWSPDIAPEVSRVIRTAFTERRFTPAATREHGQIFNLSAAIAANQGWSLIPRDAHALLPAGAMIVPLTDFAVPFPHAMLWRVDEHRPLVRTVLDVIRRVMTAERRARDAAPGRHPTPLAPMQTVPEGGRASAAAQLELRHLRYFCAVVDAGSFGRAATLLELTQPALSRQVGDLERLVGVTLLDRAARGATTTPAGESFHRSARQLLDYVASIPAETQRARRGATARCVIAGVPTAQAQGLLASLLQACANETPSIDFIVENLATPAQPAALRAGSIDLGIAHASPLTSVEERGLERTPLVADSVSCALVSSGNALATRDAIAFSELARVPFLFVAREFQPAMYDQLFAEFEQHGFVPRVDATYDGLRTLWSLAAQDRGWAIGFASQCRQPPPGTVAVPVTGFSMPWGLDLLARAGEARPLILHVAKRLRALAAAAVASPADPIAPLGTRHPLRDGVS